MKTILVPVNFTRNAANATRYATDIASSIGAALHLVHIFQLPVTVSEIPMPESVFNEMRDSGLELLSGLKTEIEARTSGTLPVTTELLMGSIETGIEDMCKKIQPFLVVMGSSDHSFENLINGSSVVRAVRHLRYPLLVIPELAKFHGVKTILLACQRKDIDNALSGKLGFLMELSDLFRTKFAVMHVLTDREESAGDLIQAYDAWKNDLKGFPPEIDFVRQSKVGEGIRQYLASHEADWLTVFPKHHSVLEFHHSQAKQIVQSELMPVMTLHE